MFFISFIIVTKNWISKWFPLIDNKLQCFTMKYNNLVLNFIIIAFALTSSLPSNAATYVLSYFGEAFKTKKKVKLLCTLLRRFDIKWKQKSFKERHWRTWHLWVGFTPISKVIMTKPGVDLIKHFCINLLSLFVG
jgi:membrane protein YqaA with SNARE-associated domain